MQGRVSARIRRSRARVGGIGFVVGLFVALPVGRLEGVAYLSLTTLTVALLCSAVGLLLWEREKGLPTLHDLQAAKFEEAMNPLGLFVSGDQREKPVGRTRTLL
jgi:hypothetical protein